MLKVYVRFSTQDIHANGRFYITYQMQ